MMALPKTIYVKEVSETNSAGGKEKYLDASYGLFDAAEDDLTDVGVYSLVETKKVRKVVEEETG